jgi:hypothetical protein
LLMTGLEVLVIQPLRFQPSIHLVMQLMRNMESVWIHSFWMETSLATWMARMAAWISAELLVAYKYIFVNQFGRCILKGATLFGSVCNTKASIASKAFKYRDDS